MAASLNIAIRNLNKAREDLNRRISRGSPDWYVQMFRVEVECCENEVAAWERISKS